MFQNFMILVYVIEEQ